MDKGWIEVLIVLSVNFLVVIWAKLDMVKYRKKSNEEHKRFLEEMREMRKIKE